MPSYDEVDLGEYPVTTAEQLESTPCSKCGHTNCEDGMELLSLCHPEAPVNAVFKQGTVMLECAECEKFVVAFRVV